MMHAPRLALAGSVPQAIEDDGDRFVVADFRQLGDQFDRFLIGHSPVLAGPVAGNPKLRVDAAFPMEVEDMLRWLIGVGHDNILEHGSQDAFLQFHRRGGMLPQRAKISPQCQQLLPLSFVQGRRRLAEAVDARL